MQCQLPADRGAACSEQGCFYRVPRPPRPRPQPQPRRGLQGWLLATSSAASCHSDLPIPSSSFSRGLVKEKVEMEEYRQKDTMLLSVNVKGQMKVYYAHLFKIMQV